MVSEQALESFSDGDKQKLINGRVRQSVRQGMTLVLNVGYPEGKKIFYPKHQRLIAMPAPGATFQVPVEVADWLLKNFYKKLQLVSGKMPSNFTPPPGYKLVPADEAPSIEGPDEASLLADPEPKPKAKAPAKE